MGRRIPPLIGDHLLAPFGTGLHAARPVRPEPTAVIVFWSAGCEASLHRLRQLSSWHRTETAANGCSRVDIWTVHSPRFPCDEVVTEVAATMERQQIPFPTVHDPKFRTWSRYNPEGWPSTVIVDRGSAVGADHGVAPIVDVLNDLAERSENVETAATTAAALNTAAAAQSGLRFPQGLAVDGDRLYIADTGNGRILSGKIQPETSTFTTDRVYDGLRRPTSVAARTPDLLAVIEANETVTAIALDDGTRLPMTDECVRPAGLCVDRDGSLVMTDSIANQILRLAPNPDRRTGWQPLPVAGSGTTGCRAGSARTADFAQPVAVTRTNAGLVVADAASSAIRLLTDAGRVLNVTDGDMYRFGLVDGMAHRALLQRPSALCALTNGDVVIADTGNDRLRLLSRSRIETLPVNGLRRPTAVAGLDDGWVVVADTHNHRVVVVNPKRRLVRRLKIAGLVGSRNPVGVDGTAQFSSAQANGPISADSWPHDDGSAVGTKTNVVSPTSTSA